MDELNCKGCYYFEICGGREKCYDYTPSEEDYTYDMIDELIERNRANFRPEWDSYIRNFND